MDTFRSFPSLAATAGHIAIVQAKLDQLAQARDQAWEQLLTAAARLYRAGELDAVDLLRQYKPRLNRSGGARAAAA